MLWAQKRDPDAVMEDARRLNKENKADSAILILKESIGFYPEYADLKVLMGSILSWNGKYDDARTYFQYELNERKQAAPFWVAYINNEIWSENYPKSLTLTYQGLNQNPDSPDIYILQAKILGKLQRPAEALLVLREASKKLAFLTM
jgi:tetratricopeptide (TPR) repeat protein